MVGEFGEVLVLDWGVARLRENAAAVPSFSTPRPSPATIGASIETAHGTILGTPAYMSPEQARGDVMQIDERTIYALGALLETLVDASTAVLAISRKAQSDVPADRYQTVPQLAADVSRFIAGRAVKAHGEPFADRLLRLAARYRLPIALVATYLAMRLLLFWIFRV